MSIAKFIKAFFCYLLLVVNSTSAQMLVRGEVGDFATNQILDTVKIRILNKDTIITRKLEGLFEFVANKGDLLEFSKEGYSPYRLRIVNKKNNLYYIIKLKPKLPVEQSSQNSNLVFKTDSTKFDQIFYTQMNGAREGENIHCPGMSLSHVENRNRRQWAFQAFFKKWQKEKYVDFIFNPTKVRELTKLSGNDLVRFMREYRPSEDFLRKSSEYEILEYIKRSYIDFSKKQGY
jgi:hypothetical protein